MVTPASPPTDRISVTFAFKVGQKVRIVALERPGVVRLLRFDGSACDYFVSWWDEGKRQSEWLSADEVHA